MHIRIIQRTRIILRTVIIVIITTIMIVIVAVTPMRDNGTLGGVDSEVSISLR